MSQSTRTERDSMGDMDVPAGALYGASTARAVLNFPISNRPLPPELIRAYGLLKSAAAEANRELDILPPGLADLIVAAASEIQQGQHGDHFPVDIYQTGSGTSTNMNVNEVIANRCSQLAGEPLGSKRPVHPNDHVNLGQSSNDTFPTAIHIAVSLALRDNLLPSLTALHGSLDAKATEFRDILKIGRTHLMDATPVRLGQVFSGYAHQLALAIDRTHKAIKALHPLPLGGTAVGTGLNTHRSFASRAIALIATRTEIEFREAENHFEAQGSRDALVEAHGQINTIATSLTKIANDIRLLGSGPRCGLGELRLPATQPGSSIMPGKVNPVMAEALAMATTRVFGNHATITHAGAGGHLELNTYMPVIAATFVESVSLLSNATSAFDRSCISGIEADADRCRSFIELSLSMVTSLAPLIGYDRAAAIAKQSVETGRTVRQICTEQLPDLGLTEQQLADALDPASMTEPS